ncbi:MAG: ACT domain-containing protein [Polyangiales bacterium]
MRGEDTDTSILIDGMNGVLVRFAKCCNPIAGDPVTGWITRGRGVSVHRRGCPHAMQLDPVRRVAVQWANKRSVDLPVSLRVLTDDRPGILASVSTVFRDNGVSINEATCLSQDDGRAENMFSFRIGDTEKLRALMRGVSRLKGVLGVERV